MKRMLLVLGLLLTTAWSVSAASVTYDTSVGSVFNCTNTSTLKGCGTNTIVIGGADGVTLYYLPVSTSVTAAPNSIANFGSIIAACNGGGVICSGQTLPAGLTLTIFFNQTTPDSGSGTITGNIAGTLGGSFSMASISWAPGTQLTLTGPNAVVTYQILNPTLYWVPPVNDNCPAPCPIPGPGGTTTIQGYIIDPPNSVPEPPAMVLLSAGAAAAGLLHRKRLLPSRM